MNPASARERADGGIAARRAVVRWAWRLFRREWRQQILVLALLTLAVTAALGSQAAASSWFSLVSAPEFGALGTANQVVTFYSPEPGQVEANIATVEEQAGTVDVIARRLLPISGSDDTVEIRAQDPEGAYGAPMLDVLEGRFPTGPAEVAVTDVVAMDFDLGLGSEFAPGDIDRRTVVGLIENPRDLRDEFALVGPGQIDAPDVLRILLTGDGMYSFSAPHEGNMSYGTSGGPNPKVGAAVAVLGITTVAMVLIALVGVTGFVIVAQRRLRQLGMLAAIGATEKHLRLVMIANGAVVGVVAAVIGAVLGLAVSIATAPALETILMARIDRFDLPPWWMVGLGMLLAVMTATAAAWWPARAAARIPVMLALSGRPPRPRPARHTAALAMSLLVVGTVYRMLAGDPGAHWINGVLLSVGTVAIVLGVVFLGPLAIRALPTAAARMPVAIRLALRDLARHRARSGAALAAITLALGISVAVVIATTLAERTTDLGNLSDQQLLITEEGGRIREVVTLRTPAEVEGLRTQVHQVAASIEDPTVIPLEMAVDPDRQPNQGRRGNTYKPAVLLGDGARTADPGPLFVATPQMLEYYGIEPDSVDQRTDVFTVRTGEVGLRYLITEEVVPAVERLDIPAYSSAPTSLITLEGLRRRDWEPALAGWLVDAGQPVTGAQLAHARGAAETAGLRVEARDGLDLVTVNTLGSGAMGAGILLVIGMILLTVGLIRGEAAGDLRTLTANGATGTIRRTLAAATVGTLAILGVTLGGIGAYLGMVAGFVTDLDTLTPIPFLRLIVIVIGVPVVAITAGWLMAGREPAGIIRQPIE